MRFATYRTGLAVLVGLVLAATGLWAGAEEEQPAAAADKQYVTDPVTGKVFTAPEYGGTLTYPRISDKGWIGQGSDQDLAELARLYALFDVEMRLGHHS